MALSRYKVVCVIIRQGNVCHGSLSTNQSGSEIDLQSEPLNFERGNFVVSISARIDRADIETTSAREQIRPEKFILYKSSFAAVSMRKRPNIFVPMNIQFYGNTESQHGSGFRVADIGSYHSSGS
jgi:hypothetical protein